MRQTFVFAELVEGLKAGGVVSVVRLERDAKKVSVRSDVVSQIRRLCAAHATHLAVHQLHVEVGKLHVVALCVLAAAAQATPTYIQGGPKNLATIKNRH